MILDCFKGSGSMNALRELFVESVIKLAAAGQNIDFKSVYTEIAKNRSIDIDMESAALLYDDIKNDSRITGLDNNIHVFMTTSEDLQNMVEGEVARILRKVGKSVDKNGKIAFQRTSTPKAIALALMNTLNNSMFGNISSTDGKAVKQFVYNYAKSILKKERPTGKVVDLLADMLEKSMKSSDFTGTSEDLFEAMKGVLGNISSKIADPAVRARFENEIQKIREAAFNFGMTESKRKNILYDVLKNSEYGKELKNGKKVVDWNKLAREEDMEASLRKVLSSKLDSLGYTGSKNKVYAALINNISNIQRGKAYQKAVSANLFKNELGKEVAIDNGFYDPKDGRKFVNYTLDNPAGRKKVKEILVQLGYPENTAETMSQRPDLEGVFDIIGADYSKARSIPSIARLVRRLMVLNNKPYRHKINEMDRLVKLQEAGYGLDSTTDALSASILGVRIKASHIEKMQDLVKRYAAVMAKPDDIYAEIAAANPGANLKFDYHGNIPLGFWASNTLERLNREMSDLIIESVGEGSRLIQSLGFIEKLQRTYLSALLTNVVNVTQNLGTAYNTLAVSGKKVLGEKRFKKFLALVILDANGALNDPTVMHREFKDWSEAETFKEKVGAFYRSFTQGVLSGIDGMAYYYATKRTFYNGIRDALKIKGQTPKEIDQLLDPYLNDEAAKKSYALAKHFFTKAGITPSSIGEARYKRELEAEAFNVQMSLLMSGDLVTGNYFTAEEIAARKESAQRLTRFDLGKELPYTMVKGKGTQRVKDYKNNIPLFNNIIAGLGRSQGVKYNAALKAFSENATFSNGMDLVGQFIAKIFLHGGPFRFGSGIAIFADKAFGTINPFSRIVAARKGYRTEYEKIKKSNNPEDARNIDEVIRRYEEFEIYRRKNYLFASATAITLATMAAIGGMAGDDDDPETDKIEEIVNAMYEMGEEYPLLKLAFTRIAPLYLRILYAKKHAEGQKDKKKAYAQIAGTLFNTGPMDMKNVIGEFADKEGVTWGKVGDLFTSTFFPNPVAAINSVIFGLINLVEDAKTGNRLTRNMDVSQVNAMLKDPFQSRGINGGIIGLTSQQLNYYLQRHRGADLGIMSKDKLRNPKEYQELKGRKYSDIDWADYGNDKLNDGKYNVDLAYRNLDRMKDVMLQLGEKLNVQRFKNSRLIEAMMRRPYPSMFLVPADKMDIRELRKIDPRITVEPGGNINMSALAAKKMGLKLDVKDILNAIQYRNFQDSLD